jgi:hypothetical protein
LCRLFARFNDRHLQTIDAPLVVAVLVEVGVHQPRESTVRGGLHKQSRVHGACGGQSYGHPARLLGTRLPHRDGRQSAYDTRIVAGRFARADQQGAAGLAGRRVEPFKLVDLALERALAPHRAEEAAPLRVDGLRQRGERPVLGYADYEQVGVY